MSSKADKQDRHVFKCPICSKALKTASELELHKRGAHKTVEQKSSTCTVCGKTFTTSYYLRRHGVVHKPTEERKLRCPEQECGKVFVNKRGLQLHLFQQHESKDAMDKPYACTYCEKRFWSSRKRNNHVGAHLGQTHACSVPGCDAKFRHSQSLKQHTNFVHSGGGPLKCGECGKLLKNSRSLKLHVQIHGSRERHMCPHAGCNETFLWKQSLRNHVSAHHTSGNEYQAGRHVCTYCSKGFLRSDQLVYHLGAHTGERPYKCTFCPKNFVNPAVHRAHEARVHLKEKLITCPQSNCGKHFVTKAGLTSHLETHQDRAARKVFKCGDCERQFGSRSGLRSHTLSNHTEHDDLKHSCTYCAKKFASATSLKTHLMSHTGEKPFGCTQCPQMFTTISNRNAHVVRAHTSVKPHGCPNCDKRFVRRAELRSHTIRIHGNEEEKKVWRCEVCGRSLSSKGGLRSHIKETHAVGRHHVCQFCDNAFATRIGLRRHIRTHTGEKPHVCITCFEKFENYSQLCGHMKSTHEDIV